MNKWIKLTLILLFFAIVSVAIFLVLKIFNITDTSTLKNIIASTEQYGILVFILIQVFALVCFCFVPVLNATLIVMGIVLFGPKWAFISCLISKAISASILFLIGDKFGEKLASKLIGKDELKKMQDLVDVKSKILLPLSFVIPAFPDEAFCIVAGMTKMKYWYFITINILCHAIEIGLFCFFGSSLINWSSLSAFDWVVVINLLVVDIYLLSKLEKFIEIKVKNNKKRWIFIVFLFFY